MTKKIIFSKKEQQKIIKLYQYDRLSSYEVGDIMKCSSGTILNFLKDINIVRPPHGRRIIFSNKKETKLIKLYNNGYSMVELADKFGVSRDIITRVLSGNNIDIRHAISFNKEDIDNIISLKLKNHHSARYIASLYNCNHQTILKLLNRNGVMNTIKAQKDKDLKEGKQRCKVCKKRKSLKKNFHKAKHRDIGYQILCKDCEHKARIKADFGISSDEYNLLINTCNNKCMICFKTARKNGQRLATDHCHNTGKIRGLLCSGCNLLLGNSQDNIKTLASAIEYLVKTSNDIKALSSIVYNLIKLKQLITDCEKQ